jgi:hypothetical protein
MQVVEQIEAVHSIRRHLGWDILIEVEPEAKTRLDSIFDLAADLEAADLKLAGPVLTTLRSHGSQTNTVQFPARPTPASMVVKALPDPGADQVFVAAIDPDPRKPAWLNMFNPGEIMTVEGELIPLADVIAWTEQRGISNPQVTVVVAGETTWRELTRVLQPLLALAPRLNVIRRSGSP